jgi:hypothetical protein
MRNKPAGAGWLQTCNISPTWWRCRGCLARVDCGLTDEQTPSAWQCSTPDCRTTCEADRQNIRLQLLYQAEQAAIQAQQQAQGPQQVRYPAAQGYAQGYGNGEWAYQ